MKLSQCIVITALVSFGSSLTIPAIPNSNNSSSSGSYVIQSKRRINYHNDPTEGKTVYDIVQFDKIDKISTQQDFLTSSFVQLSSPNCFDPNFKPKPKVEDKSSIRLLLNTTEYIIAKESWLQIGLAIKCRKLSKTKFWRLLMPDNFNKSMPYTRLTINAGKCSHTLTNHNVKITDIEIYVRRKKGAKKIGLRSNNTWSLNPHPNCARIDSFKTIFIPTLPRV